MTMRDETLGETLLEITTMMLLAIVLALLVMGAFGVSLRPYPEHARTPHTATVQVTKDHPKHADGAHD
jgi:ABC-type transporter Mla subunit MlaD